VDENGDFTLTGGLSVKLLPDLTDEFGLDRGILPGGNREFILRIGLGKASTDLAGLVLRWDLYRKRRERQGVCPFLSEPATCIRCPQGGHMQLLDRADIQRFGNDDSHAAIDTGRSDKRYENEKNPIHGARLQITTRAR
jgi:hypothetical protein